MTIDKKIERKYKNKIGVHIMASYDLHISQEEYDKLLEKILKNKSTSSFIHLPNHYGGDIHAMRRYKVCMDEEQELYVMRGGVKCNIAIFNDEDMTDIIVNTQIAYMKDDLDAENRKYWGEVFLETKEAKGLKIWMALQQNVRESARAMLAHSLKHYKITKAPRVKYQMDLLISIIKFDLENIQTNFDIYKSQFTDEMVMAETSSQDNKFRIYCPDTDEILHNDEAYLTYCNQAKKQVEQMTDMVARIYLDPRGPPPDMWGHII